MRSAIFGMLLLSSMSLPATAATLESERCHSLPPTVLSSPLDDRSDLTITSSCVEVDASEFDGSNEPVLYAVRDWQRKGLTVRRYSLTFAPRSSEERGGVKIRLPGKGPFSPYAMSTEGFTLHVAAGSRLTMGFISPHPPRWMTSFAQIKFASGENMSEWSEESLQMLLPAWTHHVYEGTKIEH